MRFHHEATLPASPERAWAVLTDWERQSDWMPDVAWLRVTGSDRELGARIAVRTKVLGIPMVTDELRVIEWDPPRRLGVAHLGLVTGTGEWVMVPSGGGDTTLDWTEDIRMPPPILGDLALWLYGPVQRWMLRRSLRNLAELLESGKP